MVATVANQEPTFTITDTKLFVPVVILSIQYNVKRSKITTNWKKYQSKVTKQVQN